MTDISLGESARLYIYKKAKKYSETFLYSISKTLFKKQDNSRHILYTKSRTLYGMHFSWIFHFFIIQEAWHFFLQDVFIYKKRETSQKAGQLALYFYTQKYGNFALRNFSLNFEIGGGERTFFIQKTMHFALDFISKKTMHLRYVFKAKSLTLCVTYLYAKTMHFALRFNI